MNWSSMEIHTTTQHNSGQWVSRTEQYLLQEHPWAAQGRGANLMAIFKPLAPSKTVATWKRGKPAFWEQLKIRFHLALKQPPQQAKGPTMGFMQAVHDAPKHWVGPPTRSHSTATPNCTTTGSQGVAKAVPRDGGTGAHPTANAYGCHAPKEQQQRKTNHLDIDPLQSLVQTPQAAVR